MVFASICEHASTASFLRARAVIKVVLRAASTSETTSGEQRTLHKFSAYFTRWFVRVRLVPSLCDYFTSRTPENYSNFPDVVFPPPGGRIGGRWN